uniref:Uncharacterized protein n=1 Tax=Panagrolaimus sp. JU765 TaxID=591449 RepID=A0AC34RLS6_9BILA
MVANSEYSRKFIKFWADYFYRLPNSFHGTDNGAIHQVFMEQHFKTNETQDQCFDLWQNSRNFDGLFTYQKCTRFALGDGSYFCDGKAKIIRKATWGWARDGWLTKTLIAPSDFMFHGWKVSKLGGEWVWPFKTPIFDATKCSPNSSLISFALTEKFMKTDDEIMGQLKAKRDETRKKYIETMKLLGKLCSDGKPPPFNMKCLNR